MYLLCKIHYNRLISISTTLLGNIPKVLHIILGCVWIGRCRENREVWIHYLDGPNECIFGSGLKSAEEHDLLGRAAQGYNPNPTSVLFYILGLLKSGTNWSLITHRVQNFKFEPQTSNSKHKHDTINPQAASGTFKPMTTNFSPWLLVSCFRIGHSSRLDFIACNIPWAEATSVRIFSQGRDIKLTVTLLFWIWIHAQSGSVVFCLWI